MNNFEQYLIDYQNGKDFSSESSISGNKFTEEYSKQLIETKSTDQHDEGYTLKFDNPCKVVWHYNRRQRAHLEELNDIDCSSSCKEVSQLNN